MEKTLVERIREEAKKAEGIPEVAGLLVAEMILLGVIDALEAELETLYTCGARNEKTSN